MLTILNCGNPNTIPFELPLNKKIINKIKFLSKLPLRQRASFVIDTVQNIFGRSTKDSKDTEEMENFSRSNITKALRVYNPEPYQGKILLVYGENYHVYGGKPWLGNG